MKHILFLLILALGLHSIATMDKFPQYACFSDALELDRVAQGFLAPRMACVVQDAIPNTPNFGLIIYDSTSQNINPFNGKIRAVCAKKKRAESTAAPMDFIADGSMVTVEISNTKPKGNVMVFDLLGVFKEGTLLVGLSMNDENDTSKIILSKTSPTVNYTFDERGTINAENELNKKLCVS